MNGTCSITKCVVPIAAVFIAMFAFNWVYHGHLLMSQYEATAGLWRPEAEMQSMMGWCLLKQLLLSAIIVWIWGKNYQNLGMAEGMRFGLMIGLLLGVHQASAYLWLPIPLSLALGWFVGEVLLGLIIGIVLSATYKRACSTPA